MLAAAGILVVVGTATASGNQSVATTGRQER